jgi:hypothetical protein
MTAELRTPSEKKLDDPAQLGHTRVKLPCGGVASSLAEEVCRPTVPTFVLLAATGGAVVAGFMAVRLLLG